MAPTTDDSSNPSSDWNADSQQSNSDKQDSDKKDKFYWNDSWNLKKRHELLGDFLFKNFDNSNFDVGEGVEIMAKKSFKSKRH